MALVNIPDNKVHEVKQRILLELSYYDEMNNSIKASDKANRIEVNIKNSIYLKSTIERYLKQRTGKNRLDIPVDTADPLDNVYTTVIEEENYDSLSSVLLSKLNTKVKSIYLRTELPIEVDINEEVIKYILSNFENIHLNFNGMMRWITLPELSSRIKNLTIESTQLYITHTIISCASSFTIKNCVLQSKPDMKNNSPSLLVSIGKDAIINNIKIADRVYVAISGKEVKKYSEWSKTTINVADYTIGFKDIYKNDKANNGMYGPLLTIAEINSVNIAGIVSLSDIPYYPLLAVKGCNKVNLSTIIRGCLDLPAIAPAIRLSNYFNCNIYNIQYHGTVDAPENSSIIQFIKVRLDSSLSISNADIDKIALLNLGGINCQKISITSSKFTQSNVIIKTDSSYIGKFILDDVSIKSTSFTLKAVSLNIDSSTKIESEGDITLNIKANINLHNSILKSKNNIIINAATASINLNKTTFDALHSFIINVDHDESDSETVSFLSLSYIVILAKSILFQGFNSLNFTDTQFERVRDIVINKCNACLLKDMVINSKMPLPVKLSLMNSIIRQSNINIFNPGSYQKLEFYDCSGNLHVAYLDDKNECECKVAIANSNMVLSFDAVSERKVSFNSVKSLGSIIYSESDIISFVPDLESSDRKYFERIKDKKSDKKKVLYGNLSV